MSKTTEHKLFERSMSMDILDFAWDEELELYTDASTQLCWLTWLTARSL